MPQSDLVDGTCSWALFGQSMRKQEEVMRRALNQVVQECPKYSWKRWQDSLSSAEVSSGSSELRQSKGGCSDRVGGKSAGHSGTLPQEVG